MPDAPNLVLVHGAWADGSCWGAVIERLQADGAPSPRRSSRSPRSTTTWRASGTSCAGRTAPPWWPATPTAARSSPPWARTRRTSSASATSPPSASTRASPSARLLEQGPPTAGPGQPAHRRPGVRLAAAGRLRRPLRRRRPARPGQGPVRGPAAAAHELLRQVMGPRRGGRCRPGTSWPRTTRPSRPTGSACSRSAWARHRRGRQRPRRDGLPPGRRGDAAEGRARRRRGRRLTAAPLEVVEPGARRRHRP